jgi:hypothetical protein
MKVCNRLIEDMDDRLGSITKVFQGGNFSKIHNGLIQDKAENPASLAFDELPTKIVIESGDSGIILTMDKSAAWSECSLNSYSKRVHRLTVSYSEELY